MLPSLGWTTITDEELRAAQRLADQGDRGVRDELGLSPVHFLYAERFFPGTSTQMTRLRYVFLVAGAYELMRQNRSPADVELELAQIERRTAVQLIRKLEADGAPLEGSGVIGWTIVGRPGQKGRPPEILPSMSYWTALTNWGLIDDQYEMPARSGIHTDWEIYLRHRRYQGEVDERRSLFTEQIERRWVDGLTGTLRHLGNEAMPLGFELETWEREILVSKLKRLLVPGTNKPTLLARIADAGRDITTLSKEKSPWSRSLLRLVHDEAAEYRALQNARRAAYLVQICRAAYDALVAQACAKRDDLVKARPILEEIDDELAGLCRTGSKVREEALALDVKELARDAIGGPETMFSDRVLPAVARFLGSVQEWIRRGERASSLLQDFREREATAKGSARARLADARDLRKEWLKRQLRGRRPAQPLDYRWSVVGHSMMGDLAKA